MGNEAHAHSISGPDLIKGIRLEGAQTGNPWEYAQRYYEQADESFYIDAVPVLRSQ